MSIALVDAVMLSLPTELLVHLLTLGRLDSTRFTVTLGRFLVTCTSAHDIADALSPIF